MPCASSRQWQTVPFLIIWLTLTAIYGFRLWHLGSALLTVVTVTLATGGLIGWQVLRGKQDADYLAEVPLLAMMFVIMVWHSRRRVTAMEEMKRVSEHNLLLLSQQRQFLQDASHELGTPIAIALGHVELIEQTAADQVVAADARVAAEELLRIRRLTSRLLLLASTDAPDFLYPAPVDVDEILVETLHRWSHLPRRWSLGNLADARVQGDSDRLTLALDALIENAVDHTDVDGQIELSARREGEMVIVAVKDSGSGIPAPEVEPDLRPVLQDRRRPEPGRRRLRPRPGDREGHRRSSSWLGSRPQHGRPGLGIRAAAARCPRGRVDAPARPAGPAGVTGVSSRQRSARSRHARAITPGAGRAAGLPHSRRDRPAGPGTAVPPRR